MSLNQAQRPTQLTNQFIRQLHENQGNRTGYFQIIQFHQKRQKYYSTHISDGYYKCKVIFRQRPSKQIDKGQIKLFSILFGTVSNQGNRVLMIFNEVKAWDYSKTIGVIRSWKFQSRNLYINGSNFIQWVEGQQPQIFKQIDSENQNEQLSVASYCASDINIRNLKSKKIIKEQVAQRNFQQNNNNYQNIPTFSFGSTNILDNKSNRDNSLLQPTQSINQKPQKNKSQSKCKSQHKYDKNRGENFNRQKKLLLIGDTQTQSQNNSGLKNKYNAEIKNKFHNIEEITQRVSQVYSKKENSSYQKNNSIKENSNKWQNRESIWKFCIQTQKPEGNQFQYDDQALFRQAKQLRSKKFQQLIEDSALQIFQELKSQSERRYSNQNKSLLQNSKKEKSVFQLLYQQSQTSMKASQASNDKPFKTPMKISNQKNTTSNSDSQFQKAIQKSIQKTRTLFSLTNQLSARELNTHFSGYQSCKNWICVRILCMKFLTQGKMLVILQNVKENEDNYLFNMVLTGADIYCPFEEGILYQLSLIGIEILQPVIRQYKADIQLLANSQDITARKTQQFEIIKSIQPISHPYYVPIAKIQDLAQGISINIIGLISRFKNFSNKKKGSGWANILTIVDPFTGSNIDYTIFDQNKVTYEPGSPFVVFNALVKFYQGKRTLNTRNFTSCFIGKEVYQKFSKFIPQLQQIRIWEQKGNTINNIARKVQNFRLLYNLLQVQTTLDQSDPNLLNVQTPICRVIKVSPFFIRIICDQCNKKMVSLLSCFRCGKRENPLKQVNLSLIISDRSHTCYVQFNQYDSISYIGEQGEKFSQFSTNITHRRLKLWLTLNPKYKPTVIKMQIIQQDSQFLTKQLSQLKEMLKYI